jgi:type IV pilus assembly protein PilM
MGFLTKKIFSYSNNICGLDLSDLSVKVVLLKADGRQDHVSGFGFAAIPAGAIIDGEIKKNDQVVDAIHKAFASSCPKRIKTKKVICSLPETKAFLRVITIPEVEKEEINEAVKWEMEENIPLPLDQVYYDWQLIGKGIVSEKGKMNLLVVAVAKNVVDQAIEILEMAGLEPFGLEIESVAQSRSLIDEREEKITKLIVDIGDRRTSFTILDSGIPCFTSSIPLCGQSLSDAIAKSLGVSFEDAEKMKFNYGIGYEMKDETIFNAVEPVLENLVSEIERSLDFYLSGLQYSGSVESIIVCGGGSNTKGIIPYLAKRLKKEVILGNPWVNMRLGKTIPSIDRQSSVQYSTAIGLALKGLRYEDIS